MSDPAPNLAWIANYIWGIADDVLRDLYVRGKYRDVILPMTVLRRLDAVLEATKEDVMAQKRILDDRGIAHQDGPLRQASGHPFYNTSRFTMKDLKSIGNQQQLRADFEAYLLGFSPNVQDILNSFEFHNQIPRLSKADALGNLVEKLTSPDINLSPDPVLNPDGSVKHPGLDNHAMGTIFEELVRRFNEENNEEAGEHWTPRDAVKLMANLVFLPVADQIESSTYLIYDGACGTGGMLTLAEDTLNRLAAERGKDVSVHLFGQEINQETHAICIADLLLKGEGDDADNIVGGPEHSTLSNDAWPKMDFDFMLSNPPYGKSWKTDLERMGGKKHMHDARFVINHADDPEYSLVTRSSDGQMLFLANMLSKMKHDTPLGSRIAEVHNGSSLFTGDAGQGESNIRRWIIENDWLEAIVALPLNMFYNTGIATYIWVLTNRKPAHRQGKIQLIDATEWHQPLRKNLGNKNCELGEAEIQQICDTFTAFEETEQSKIFPNQAFGYWKVKVERPLRAEGIDPERVYKASEIKKLRDEQKERQTDGRADAAAGGPSVQQDTATAGRVDDEPAGSQSHGSREADEVLGSEKAEDASTRQAMGGGVAESTMPSDTEASPQPHPVIKKIHKNIAPNPIQGLFAATINGKPATVEYESDPTLRDTEQIPLLEEGGIEAFIQREVLPYAPDAWYVPESVKIGYEISFTRHFYKPTPLRPLEEIRGDIIELEEKTKGIIGKIINT